MILTQERLELIRSVQRDPDRDSYYFWPIGKDKKNGEWCVALDEITQYGKEDNQGLAPNNKIPDEYFLEHLDIAKRGVTAGIFLGWEEGKESYFQTDDWDEFAKRIGISKLVSLTTKVPETIAKRFEFFANSERSNVSAMTRELIIQYVEKEWKEGASELIFKADI